MKVRYILPFVILSLMGCKGSHLNEGTYLSTKDKHEHYCDLLRSMRFSYCAAQVNVASEMHDYILYFDSTMLKSNRIGVIKVLNDELIYLSNVIFSEYVVNQTMSVITDSISDVPSTKYFLSDELDIIDWYNIYTDSNWHIVLTSYDIPDPELNGMMMMLKSLLLDVEMVHPSSNNWIQASSFPLDTSIIRWGWKWGNVRSIKNK